MDSQELARRLMGIAKRESSATITERAERACWFDGEECPYGKPEGQFLKRPRTDCKPRTDKSSGCLKLNDHLEDLDDLVSRAVLESVEKEVSEKVKKAITSVSSELSALADDAESDKVKEVLKLAAELIEEKEDGLEDRKIVLLEDLDIE